MLNKDIRYWTDVSVTLKYKTMKQNIIDCINHLANEKEPFLFGSSGIWSDGI